MEKRCFGCMRLKTQSPLCEHCGYNENIDNLPHQLPLGTVLHGQYEIGKVLGQGGFGITYLGWDRALENPVAIKEYYPNGIVNRECSISRSVTSSTGNGELTFEHNRKRFLKEAKTLAKLGSVPGIVRVHNLFEENETAYIVMEYVQGMDLRRYVQLSGGRLSPEQTFTILKPVMQALEKVHGADLVHRDISPDNIMLLPDGSAKLLDFGAAREVVDADAGRELSQSTEAILKHGFAPMEQYQKKGSLGPWTDVYAMCATIFYCLTGQVPPDAPARMMEEIDPEWDAIPGLTPAQRNMLKHGMELRAKDRPASMRELAEGLFSHFTEIELLPKEPAAKEEPLSKADTILQKTTPENGTVSQRTPQPEKTPPVKRADPPATDSVTTGKPGKKLPFAAIAAIAAVALCAIFFLNRKPETNTTIRETNPPKPGTAAVTEAARQPVQPEAITLRVWSSMDDQRNASSFLPVACEKFQQAHPEYIITWELAGHAEGEIADIIRNTQPDEVADVYMYANDQVSVLADAGVLARLDGDYLEQMQADNSTAMIQSVTYNGGVYGFPFSANTWFMYYDKSVYSEQDIRSLDKMMAKKPVSFPVTNSWYLSAFYFAAGGTMYGEGTDASAGIRFDTQDCALATAYVAEALRTGKLVNDDNYTGLEMLRSGAVGAFFSGSWSAAEVQEILGSNFAAAQLPCITLDGEERQLRAFSGSKVIGVNPNAACPEAAMQLAAWLSSPEMQILRYELSGTIPCSLEVALENPFAGDPVAEAQSKTAAYTSKVQPTIPEMASYWDPMQRFGEKLVSGKVTAGNAAQMTKELNSTLNG